MKKAILGVLTTLIVLGLNSCISEKKRAEICANCPVVTISKDSTYEHLVYDTITLPPVVGPVQWMENPCKVLCDSLGHLKPFIYVEHKNGMTSTIKSRGDIVTVNCDADSLKAYSTHLQKELYKITHDTKIIDPECEKWHINGFLWFLIWSGAIFWFIIIVWIIVKALKAYFGKK